MNFKNNLGKFMDVYGLSLAQISRECQLSINTLREVKRNPNHNLNLESLSILAQALECSIKDLIEDDIAILNYERIAETCKNDTMFIRDQVFSPANVNHLNNLFLQVGVSCKIEPYNWYKTVSIKNTYNLSSIQVDINIRAIENNGISTLKVVDFYVNVNQKILKESVIKDVIIKALEIYARKLKFNRLHFINMQNSTVHEDNFSNVHSEIPAHFTFSAGAESALFEENGYELFFTPDRKSYDIEWWKVLAKDI